MTNIKQSRDFKPDFVKGEGFFRLEWIFPFSTTKTTFTCIFNRYGHLVIHVRNDVLTILLFDKETMAYCLQLQVSQAWLTTCSWPKNVAVEKTQKEV